MGSGMDRNRGEGNWTPCSFSREEVSTANPNFTETDISWIVWAIGASNGPEVVGSGMPKYVAHVPTQN